MANSASLSAILSAILSARIDFSAPGDAMVGVGSLNVKHGAEQDFTTQITQSNEEQGLEHFPKAKEGVYSVSLIVNIKFVILGAGVV